MMVSDQLQKQVMAWSEMLRSGVLSAVEFTKEQLPGIANEMLVYGRTTNTLYLLASIAGAYLLQRMFRSGITSKDRDDIECMTGGNAALVAISSVAAIPCFVVFCISFEGFVMSWFAPRLYLIKEFSRILD